jgi:MoaA/NifB/PqqE/SkfB family radical SAM enzyme
MECVAKTIADHEYFRQFSEKTIRQRIPVYGGLELTRRCNLQCVHCYADIREDIEGLRGRELDTGRICGIIDEVADAGCLFLLLTGGEPLLHRDFEYIYRHIKSRGILVTVFTNATLITDKTAELFAGLPPYSIEISVYGATEETCRRVTGAAGALDGCLDGISLLLRHGVKHVQLKTVLMTLNRHEFVQMKKIAIDKGLDFRMDAMIFPRFNGDRSPLEFRVAPDEAVDREFSDDRMLHDMKKYYGRMKDLPASDGLYHCGAGITNFHIDAYGNLAPCLMPTGLSYNLAGGSFREGWDNVINGIMNKKAGDSFRCNGCEKMALCSYCPAFFYAENGAEDIKSDYLCEIGGLRYEKIHSSG